MGSLNKNRRAQECYNWRPSTNPTPNRRAEPVNSQALTRVRSPMDTLTPELKRAVDQAGDSPVRLMDPETRRAYVLVSAEVYDRLLLKEEDWREQEAFLRAAKKNAKARL